MQTADPAQARQSLSKKLMLGFATLASAATIGAVGLAGAAPTDKPTKAECAEAGFKNYGQCVKEWAHGRGIGYGGDGGGGAINANVETNVNAEVNGDNNIVDIVISIFVGS